MVFTVGVGMSWIKDYRLVADLDEAVELLGRADEGWAVLGGGSRLVAQRPAAVERLVDLLPLGLDRIETLPDGGLRLGARVRLQTLADRSDFGGLLRAASLSLGHSLNLRNQMTLAGETAWPLVLSELQTALVALDARVLRHGLPAAPARDYFAGASREGVITAIEFPPAPDWRFGFHAVRAAEAARPQLVLAAGARLAGGGIAECRLAYGRLGERPQRARGLEARLIGAPPLPLGLGALSGMDREGLALLSEPGLADEAKWAWAAALADEFLVALGAPPGASR
jgi:CO/xanthine dehydrogenase FAD-binding subunit